jgi:hypothetical protein
MTFKVNAKQCTALSKDLITTIVLKENEVKNIEDFYIPSLIPLATNGLKNFKDGKEITIYEPSIDLDVSKLDLTGESLNSLAKEISDAKVEKSKQPIK